MYQVQGGSMATSHGWSSFLSLLAGHRGPSGPRFPQVEGASVPGLPRELPCQSGKSFELPSEEELNCVYSLNFGGFCQLQQVALY